MAHNKIDGIVETVRYSPDGLINMVRSYQRHGAVWSDHILLNRLELIQQLSEGKHYVTGVRKEYLGSVFETKLPINYINNRIITEGQVGLHDVLAGVPIF